MAYLRWIGEKYNIQAREDAPWINKSCKEQKEYKEEELLVESKGSL